MVSNFFQIMTIDTLKQCRGHMALTINTATALKTRKCVYETLCPQLVSHFQDVKMSKK